jgi:hypothetical protein
VYIDHILSAKGGDFFLSISVIKNLEKISHLHSVNYLNYVIIIVIFVLVVVFVVVVVVVVVGFYHKVCQRIILFSCFCVCFIYVLFTVRLCFFCYWPPGC